jgi:putative hydrolase of the HAD superfamily
LLARRNLPIVHVLTFAGMIRNIIFDLGGVIINLDMQATAKAFRALGMADFDRHFTQAKQSGLFDEFDRGKISPQEFRNGLKPFLPAGTSDEAIDKAWNAMLLDVPEYRLEALLKLKGKYRTFLLSNTNEIHVGAFSAALRQAYGFADFSGFFERWYYSCRMGKRKPDEEIFRQVLLENGLDANETLFIDDSIQHVEGARKTGIRAEWLEPGKEFSLMIEKILPVD